MEPWAVAWLSGLAGAVASAVACWFAARRHVNRLEIANRQELTAAHSRLDAEWARLREQADRDEARRDRIEQREAGHAQEERRLRERAENLDRREAEIEDELARMAALSKTQARDLYLKRIDAEFREVGLQRAKEAEAAARASGEQAAKRILLDAMQRTAVDTIAEATVAVVELPSEDMKGRIIGREGRNIRAFEQVTGVDLIVDETPEAVVISSFDPIRRETARLTLMNLMVDGRIHPVRIEELHEKAKGEIARLIREAGDRAAERAGVPGLPPATIEALGRLRFRTSYAQNVLDHSVEVARLAELLAHEMGVPAEAAKRAGLLHDIGKALGPETTGPHAITGMEFLRGQGEKEPVLNAVGAHHQEIEPAGIDSWLVILADTISASRPGARRESLDNYIKRLSALEKVAAGFPGVDRVFAVQAGREIRLIVRPEEIDDLAAKRLAVAVAKRIEQELEYPGQVKVTVIRETRVSHIAK
jgi:ribonuclease Y